MDNSISEFEWDAQLPMIVGERIALRGLGDDRVSDILAIFSDPDVMRYWDSPPLRSTVDAAVLLSEIREGFQTKRLFQWGILELASDRVIGTCTIWRVDRAHRRAEIGFALARRYWGKGLAGRHSRFSSPSHSNGSTCTDSRLTPARRIIPGTLASSWVLASQQATRRDLLSTCRRQPGT